MTFTFWVAMAVEKTTIIHACYLMQHFFPGLLANPLYPMKALLAARLRQFSSGVRRSCLWSNGILGFSMAVSDI